MGVELDGAAFKLIMSFACSEEVAFGKELSGQPSQSGRSLIMFTSIERAMGRWGTCELSRVQRETHATKTHNKDKGKKVAKSLLCGWQVFDIPGHSTHINNVTLSGSRRLLLPRMWFRPGVKMPIGQSARS